MENGVPIYGWTIIGRWIPFKFKAKNLFLSRACIQTRSLVKQNNQPLEKAPSISCGEIEPITPDHHHPPSSKSLTSSKRRNSIAALQSTLQNKFSNLTIRRR